MAEAEPLPNLKATAKPKESKMHKITKGYLFRGSLSVIEMATTYFPTSKGSIIGADGLNYSVRNGKRWTPSLKSPAIG